MEPRFIVLLAGIVLMAGCGAAPSVVHIVFSCHLVRLVAA